MKNFRNKGLIIYILILSLVFVNGFLPIVYGDSEEVQKEESNQKESNLEPLNKENIKNESLTQEDKSKEDPKESKPEEKLEENTKSKPEPEEKEQKKEMLKANLSLEIKTDKNSYKPWENIVYTVQVKNEGNVDLKNVIVKDSITNLNQNIKLLKIGETKEIKTIYNKFSSLEKRVKVNTFIASTKFNNESITQNKKVEVKLLKPEIIKKKNSSSAFIEEHEIEKFPKEYQKFLDELFKESIAKSSIFSALSTYRNPDPQFEDTITVDKTAESVEGCREYLVTLEIDGEIPQKPIDVILVIDRSGSMNDGSAITYAKNAAKSFSQTVLQNPNSRVALVSYAYSGSIYGWGSINDATLDTNFTNNYNLISNEINSLVANGGTNAEAGFRTARITMANNSRPEANKAIVFLTDGVPTVSIGNWYGPSEPTYINNHAQAAINEGQNSQNVARVFTVGLLNGVPAQSLGVARSVLQQAQDSGYYETFSAADLTQIYNEISENLNYIAKDAVVKDKINDNFVYVEGSLSSNEATYDENTHEITWNAGTITEKTTLTYKIKAKCSFEGGNDIPTNDWAKLNYIDVNDEEKTKDFPVPKVDVIEPLKVDLGPDLEMTGDTVNLADNIQINSGHPPYTYIWTSSSDPTWVSYDANPQVSPNEDTTYKLVLKDKYGEEGCSACIAEDEIVVKVIRGSITIEKIVINEDPSTKFSIWIDGPEEKQWALYIKEGETKTIENLKPGNYNINEIVPMNYELVGYSQQIVTISSENLHQTVTITNKRINDSWFYDDDEKPNKFKVQLEQ
ncbi:vWA domain-containing protein [Senegalia massiliensis]|uniref:VWA domain-containing protein n=1 Tax=Senegalia massiliensis TaxID=1720316 RepID=A0A845QXS4_9CLOT|nr:vWA domain-containing protein [Senegalia massiliensis]NBI05952.1 VWA domain-containing protein [Senegalia massiliensis]